MYHHMSSNLQATINNDKVPIELRNAAAAGLLKLNTYYEYARKSHYTILATGMLRDLKLLSSYWLTLPHAVLHPSLRTQWFGRVVSGDAQAGAEELFRLVYAEYQQAYESETRALDTENAAPTPSTNKDSGFISKVFGLDNTKPTAFKRIAEKSEVDRYLSGEGFSAEDNHENPLAWWKVRVFVINWTSIYL